jgi:hypothetical protein
VWDLETARLLKNIDAHQSEVVVIKFKDNTLVSGSADISMKVLATQGVHVLLACVVVLT